MHKLVKNDICKHFQQLSMTGEYHQQFQGVNIFAGVDSIFREYVLLQKAGDEGRKSKNPDS